MKIKLDEVEIGQIVKEWAMQTYKTKNVSVLYEMDVTPASMATDPEDKSQYIIPAKFNSISINVEVTLREDQGQATSQLAEEAVRRVRQATGVVDAVNNIEADLSPQPNNSSVPLS